MGRRLLFVLGLASAIYGGWLVHREGTLNAYCNALASRPTLGFSVPPRCPDIGGPDAGGFVFAVLGGLFVFAGLVLTRRTRAGERRYLKDLKAGRYSRENDHLNAHHFNLQRPAASPSPYPRDGASSDEDSA